MADEDKFSDDFVEVSVLTKGNTLHYVVPSFPGFNAELVEVKLQWEEYHKGLLPELHVFDGFARNCENLDHPLPATAYVEFSYDCAFIIHVSIYSNTYNSTYVLISTYREKNLADLWTLVPTFSLKMTACLCYGNGIGLILVLAHHHHRSHTATAVLPIQIQVHKQPQIQRKMTYQQSHIL